MAVHVHVKEHRVLRLVLRPCAEGCLPGAFPHGELPDSRHRC